MAFQRTRRELFDVLRQKSSEDRSVQIKHLQNHLIMELQVDDKSLELMKVVENSVKTFCSKVFAKWDNSHRTLNRFLQDNSSWLEKEFDIPNVLRSTALQSIESSSSAGRPSKAFEESSIRTKRRKTKELRQSTSSAELTFATEMSLRGEGKRTAAKLVHEVASTSPNRPYKILKVLKEAGTKPTCYTEDEALGLVIEGKLSKHQYSLIRSQAKERNANIYPSYNNIVKAKQRCYPPKENITITESSAEVQLQALLDHTTRRIIETVESVITFLPTDHKNLIMISKWGFDGSSGQSQYKQNSYDPNFIDSDLFLTSLVPLQMYFQPSHSSEKIIVWQNPRPSSTRFCRPLRFQFKKETTALASEEQKHFEGQIDKLIPSELEVSGNPVTIKHELLLTMVDGKVCNAMTSTASAQTCYVCGAKPTQMNNIDEVMLREVNISTFQFGLSTLHAWIRFFECLLHVSYRLEIKKWQSRGEEDKAGVSARKQSIQSKFKQEMGLMVDLVKPGGSGTSNDGNTARRFFKHPALSASITGIDEDLIRRFGVILQTISSGYEVKISAFHVYIAYMHFRQQKNSLSTSIHGSIFQHLCTRF